MFMKLIHPLSDQNSHQAHFHETTCAQALNHFLELWWRLILMKVGVALAVYEGSNATGVPEVLEVEHNLTLVGHIP